MANIKQQEEQRLNLLKQVEESEARIAAQNEKIAVSKAKEAKRLEKVMKDEKERLKLLKDELTTSEKILASSKKRAETLKKQAEFKKEILADSENELSSFSKLSTKVKNALKTETSGLSGLAQVSKRIQDINTQILLLKTDGKKMTEDEKTAARQKREELLGERDTLKSNREELLKQVESYLDIKKGTISEEKQRIQEELDYREAISKFDKQTQTALMSMFEQRTNFLDQEKRIKQVQDRYDAVTGALPGKLGSIVTGAEAINKSVKSIGLGWAAVVAILAIVVSEYESLSSAGKEFRQETGLLNSQTEKLKQNIAKSRVELAALGVEAKDLYDVVKAYTTTFSDLIQPSKELTDTFAVLSANFGVSAETSADVLAIMQSMSDVSDKTGAAIMLQVKDIAKMAKVAPKKIFEDIQKASEKIATYLGDSVEKIFKVELGAKTLGLSIEDVLSTTESLLNFEENIGAELQANAQTAGQFNLTQARILAAAGEQVKAQEEVFKQINRGRPFAQKEFYEKVAIAKALGTSVGKLAEQNMLQQKITKYSADEQTLIRQKVKDGLDITNMDEKQLDMALQKAKTEQEINGQLTNTMNQFKAIGAELGATLMPLLSAFLDIIKVIGQALKFVRDLFSSIGSSIRSVVGATGEISEGMKPLVGIVKAIAMAFAVWASMSAYAGVAAALAGTIVAAPLIPVLAGAAAAAVLTGGLGIINSIADGVFPAGEGPIVSTREGGIFQGTKNDDVMMGPGISKSVGGISESSGKTNSAQNAVLNKMAVVLDNLQKNGISAYTTLDGAKVDRSLGYVRNKNTRNILALPL